MGYFKVLSIFLASIMSGLLSVLGSVPSASAIAAAAIATASLRFFLDFE
jgi:hypothetical protein